MMNLMLIPPRKAIPAKIKITNQTLALVVNCPMIYKNIKLFNIDYKINYDTQPKKHIGINIIPCFAAESIPTCREWRCKNASGSLVPLLQRRNA